MKPPYEQNFATADEFLAELTLIRPQWRHPGPRWIFRGQGDARWSLTPSVLRTKAGPPAWWRMGEQTPGRVFDLAKIDANDRHQRESAGVLQFREIADQSGLPIPGGDSAQMRSWRHLSGVVGAPAFAAFGGGLPPVPKHRWPPPELLSVVALAQHYRVPTRLLDWSWKPRVAAYFAARDVQQGAKSAELAVWALHLDLVDYGWVKQHTDPDVEVVHAPQAGNPNLAAQAGVFTVARHLHEDAGLEVELERVAGTLGVQIQDFFRKMTLPSTEARALMARLWYEQVSAASVFPGYGGVVEAIREADWWNGVP